MSILHQRIEAAADEFPVASEFCLELLELSPTLLSSQIEFLIDHRAAQFWPEVERLVPMSRAAGGDPAKALIEYTVVYLREQAQFMMTRQYSHATFDTALSGVYDNPEVMEAYYLDGLLLSHAFWPIHLDIHQFFRDEFLTRLPPTGEGAEFGFGHGLYLLDTLNHCPATHAQGYDISEYSQQYAAKVLRHGNIDPSRWEIGYGNVCEPLPQEDGELSWAICAEVMEHIPDPLLSFAEICRCMKLGAPLFCTTVVNSNAIDHLYLFEDVQEIRDLLKRAGFNIVAEKVLRVADYSSATRDPSIDVAFICTPSVD